MVCSKVLFIVIVVLLDQMFSEVATSQCESLYSIYGMMLDGHVFKTIRTSMSHECLNACNDDPRCQSFNYDILQNICELNNLTKEAGPQYFVKNTERYYITVKGVNKTSVFNNEYIIQMRAVGILDKLFVVLDPLKLGIINWQRNTKIMNTNNKSELEYTS